VGVYSISMLISMLISMIISMINIDKPDLDQNLGMMGWFCFSADVVDPQIQDTPALPFVS